MGVEDDDGNRDEYFAPSLKTWSFYTFFVCVCVFRVFVGSLLCAGYRCRAKIEAIEAVKKTRIYNWEA